MRRSPRWRVLELPQFVSAISGHSVKFVDAGRVYDEVKLEHIQKPGEGVGDYIRAFHVVSGPREIHGRVGLVSCLEEVTRGRRPWVNGLR